MVLFSQFVCFSFLFKWVSGCMMSGVLFPHSSARFINIADPWTRKTHLCTPVRITINFAMSLSYSLLFSILCKQFSTHSILLQGKQLEFRTPFNNARVDELCIIFIFDSLREEAKGRRQVVLCSMLKMAK